jgi:diphthine-ammonia ligase
MATPRPRAAVSWSGGKDSCAALQRARDTFDVEAMITMCDEDAGRSRSHGLRPEVLDAQASRLGLARIIGRCAWSSYDAAFADALANAAARGITHVIFGDILFEEHRRWAERICAAAGLTAVEPLWGESTDALFDEWVSSGGEAVIVTARAEYLDESWLGRALRPEMFAELRQRGVDACGERGEYHTLVTGTPLFSAPLRWRRAGHVLRSGCWALDVAVEP